MKDDRHYSPADVADRVVGHIAPDAPSRFFDPTVGGGALLAAAQLRFTKSQLLGVDVDKPTVLSLAATHPDWFTGVSDSLNRRSVLASPVWRRARSTEPIYGLLNPPFSFRGGAGVRRELGGREYTVSPAAAFLLETVRTLPALEGLVAVLPEGVWTNVRDEPVWEWISERFGVEYVEKLGHRAFSGVIANTFILRLSKSSRGRRRAVGAGDVRPIVSISTRCMCVDVIRGRVPVARAQGQADGKSLILHSTDLRPSSTSVKRYAVADLATDGPFVAIPRVGPGPRGRVSTVLASDKVLSDCVFAIRPKDPAALETMRTFLESSIDDLANLYTGTGARHLTVKVLMSFLDSRGWKTRHTPASAAPSQCSCEKLSTNT